MLNLLNKKQKKNDFVYLIKWLVISTGISSVITQILTIREFMVQFHGNEFIIAMILFIWLVMGGIGSLLARWAGKNVATKNSQIISGQIPELKILAWISLALSIIPLIQLFVIRKIKSIFFLHGISAGFSETLSYVLLTISLYTILLGFVLPYSLFVIKKIIPEYSGTKIYILDNLGDAAGGALFSFLLVFFCNPFVCVFISCLVLFTVSVVIIKKIYKNSKIHIRILQNFILIFCLIIQIFLLNFEHSSLSSPTGHLVYYKESKYGRIQVFEDSGQYTFFQGGSPVFSSENSFLAEQIIHFPLSQLSKIKNLLLVSAQGGVMEELQKYNLENIDYLELDPEITKAQFKFKLIKKIPGLNVIHEDGRRFLYKTTKKYDAIIINLPEPDTFQVNRFFTMEFFELAKSKLSDNGVLSFSTEGFANYLSDIQQKKLSSLYNSVASIFKNVLILPGHRVFFICSDSPLGKNIDKILEKKQIKSNYISGYYNGDITDFKIDYIKNLLQGQIDKNTDFKPHLIKLMFFEWFYKHSSSPFYFYIFLSIFLVVYISLINSESFTLFSTGFTVMGSEILIIFAFQIFFGYVYFQLGIIVTLYLIGLFPGALLGDKLKKQGRKVLACADFFIMFLMIVFLITMITIEENISEYFFLVLVFFISLACGFQFPVALHLSGNNKSSISNIFAADLIGASMGALLVSVIFIPYFGISGTVIALLCLKILSLLRTLFHPKNYLDGALY